jgi:hypothetical protein
MSSTLTILVQHALALHPFGKTITVIDGILATVLILLLSEREILHSRFPRPHSQSRVLNATIPPLLLAGVIVITVRLAELLR